MLRSSLAVLICSAHIFAIGSQHGVFRSQSTQGPSWTGTSSVVDEHYRVTVLPTCLDIELDLEFNVGGSAPDTFKNALEIVGNINMAPNSAVMSMLLWNGEDILKAKLKTIEQARDEYEEVVDRDAEEPPKPRDPVIFEYGWGRDNYYISIFPVTWGKTRKLRIRYVVPGTFLGNEMNFAIPRAFSSSPRLTLYKSDNVKAFSVLTPNSTEPIAVFADSIESDNISNVGWGITKISVQNSCVEGTAFRMGSLDMPSFSGEIVSAGPFDISSILALAKSQSPSIFDTTDHSHLEVFASIGNGETACSTGVVVPHPFATDISPNQLAAKELVIHSSKPIEQKIFWVIYKNNQKVYSCIEIPETEALASPRLLAASAGINDRMITLDRELPKSLGAAIGFVDKTYALLALEEDILPEYLMAQYRNRGVPLLNPEEIFAATKDLVSVSAENLYQDMYTTPAWEVSSLPQGIAKQSFNGISAIFENGELKFNLRGSSLDENAIVTVTIFTANGRFIGKWILRGKKAVESFTWSPNNSGLAAGKFLVTLKGAQFTHSQIVTIR